MSEVVSTTGAPETGKYYGGTVTAGGRNLITSLIAGQTIEFTRVVVGSGKMPEGVEPIDMTDLVNPIAEASSSAPTVDNQVVSMLIEYRNDMNGGLKQGFWLREFGIYAKTEDTEEVLLYYATLGDSPQPVNAFQENRIDVRRYPVAIELFVDADLKLGYIPGAFVTSAEVQAMVDAMVEKAIADMGTTVMPNFVIPMEGWEDGHSNSDSDEPSGLRLDIPDEFIRENMVPSLCIHPAYLEIAKGCELSTSVRTLDGALRVYAKSVPAADMTATLTLMCATSGAADVGAPYSLPVATATRLGGVKVGEGLSVKADGTLSVDSTSVAEKVGSSIVDGLAETDENVNAMLDEVYGTGGAT